MRILITSNFYVPDRWLGGVPTATRTLAQMIHSLGHQVTVLVQTPAPPGYQEPDPFPVERGITVEKLKRFAQQADVVVVANDALGLIMPVARVGTPYIVIHHRERAGCPSGTAYRNREVCHPGLTGRCWICSVPSLGDDAPPRFTRRLRRIGRYMVARWYLKRAAANICLSERSVRLIRPPNCHLIPNPIDPLFTPGTSQRAESSPLRMACVGRLYREKNFAFVLDLLSRMPKGSYRMDIIGDGPERKSLEQHTRSLQLEDSVTFHGLKQGADLLSAYRAADVVLIPSDFEESFCLVAAESLACGTPVVASDRGALPDTVGPGGITLPLEDGRRWLETLRALCGSSDLLRTLGTRGLQHVTDNYSQAAVAYRYERLLKTVVSNKCPNAR